MKRSRSYDQTTLTRAKMRNASRHRAKRAITFGATRSCPAVCECCGKRCSRLLALDHDHKTGKFRGWLCAKCNTGIGLLGDAEEGLLRALGYLRGAVNADAQGQKLTKLSDNATAGHVPVRQNNDLRLACFWHAKLAPK